MPFQSTNSNASSLQIFADNLEHKNPMNQGYKHKVRRAIDCCVSNQFKTFLDMDKSFLFLQHSDGFELQYGMQRLYPWIPNTKMYILPDDHFLYSHALYYWWRSHMVKRNLHSGHQKLNREIKTDYGFEGDEICFAVKLPFV